MAHSRTFCGVIDVLRQLESDDSEEEDIALSDEGCDIDIGGGIEVRGGLKEGLRVSVDTPLLTAWVNSTAQCISHVCLC